MELNWVGCGRKVSNGKDGFGTFCWRRDTASLAAFHPTMALSILTQSCSERLSAASRWPAAAEVAASAARQRWFTSSSWSVTTCNCQKDTKDQLQMCAAKFSCRDRMQIRKVTVTTAVSLQGKERVEMIPPAALTSAPRALSLRRPSPPTRERIVPLRWRACYCAPRALRAPATPSSDPRALLGAGPAAPHAP